MAEMDMVSTEASCLVMSFDGQSLNGAAGFFIGFKVAGLDQSDRAFSMTSLLRCSTLCDIQWQ